VQTVQIIREALERKLKLKYKPQSTNFFPDSRIFVKITVSPIYEYHCAEGMN